MLDPNFIMAILWLLGALALFVWQWRDPNARGWIIGANISLGWLFVLLGLYKLARWWNWRSYAAARRAVAAAERRREHEMRQQQPTPTEYNPTFDFNNPPRPEDEAAR
jgi:hypothetical protein